MKALILALALSLSASIAHAGPLVVNGDFNNNGGSGQLDFNTTANGWSTNGILNAIYTDAASARAGAIIHAGDILPMDAMTIDSPTGGAFLAADADPYWSQPVYGTITGMVIGHQYMLRFNWAGTQQLDFPGATTERWDVKIGDDPVVSTETVSIPHQGFSGWRVAQFLFTAKTIDTVLEFLAVGTPGGGVAPPFALMDGVTIGDPPDVGPPQPINPPPPVSPTPTPEPASLVLLGSGFAFLVRRMQRRA